jgi:hypothetical protein
MPRANRWPRPAERAAGAVPHGRVARGRHAAAAWWRPCHAASATPIGVEAGPCRPGAVKAQSPGPTAKPDQGRSARHHCGEEPDEPHVGLAARIRRVIRCRASSAPG